MADRSWTKSLLAAISTFLIAMAFASPPAQATEPVEVKNPDPEHSILVINVGWQGPTEDTSSPPDPVDSHEIETYIQNHVNGWYEKSAPGIFHDWEANSVGPYEIEMPAIPVSHPEACPGTQAEEFLTQLNNRADAAARAKGIEPNTYTLTIVTWEAIGICELSGVFTGRHIDLPLAFRRNVTHELGHYYGLPHAHSLSCTSGGVPVPFGGSCASMTYGDTYDTMGMGAGAFNAVLTNDLGWLNGQFVSLGAGDYSQTWTLKPYTETPFGLRAMRLVDGGNTFWLEYRQNVGIDAPSYNECVFLSCGTPGLIVHREVANSTPGGKPVSEILDMTPSSDPSNAGLPVGQTWANPLGEMKITLNSANSSGATVTIASQRVTLPNLIGDGTAEARSQIEGLGLKWTGWQLVNDASCEYINLVKYQSPPAGSRLMPGTPVTLQVGQIDKKHPCQ